MSPTLLYQLALFVHILGAFGLIAALTAELRVRAATLVGVLFVMTVKPGLLACLVAVAVAMVLGYAAGRIPRRGFSDARV